MKQLLLITTFNFALLTFNCFAQQNKIDSLLTLIQKDKEDTSKVIHLNELGWALMYQNPDTAIILGNLALDIITPIPSPEFNSSKEIIEGDGVKSLRAITLGNLGVYHYFKGDYPRAIDYYLKALKIDEKLKNKKGIIARLGNIGNVYSNQGNYPKALHYSFKALKMAEELADKKGIADNYVRIGIIYHSQEDYSKALDYYFRALKIAEELRDKNLIEVDLGNIGLAYSDQGDDPKALDYFLKALKMTEELGNKNGIARHFSNIGLVYYRQAIYPKALDYYFKALKMNEELENKNSIAITQGNIGALYTKTGKFKEAEQYLKRSLALNDSIGAMDNSSQIEELLSQLYDTTALLAIGIRQYAIAAENYKLSMLHYKKAKALNDTLFSQENKKQLVRKEMNFEFEKKEAAAKAENEKQQAIAIAEKNKQQFVLILVSCVLLLVFLFTGFVFRSLRITRKQKNIIELQKRKVIDSITYAQRIQQSILMEENEIRNYLPDSFIYYQPKDIVSGDFYWCSAINGKIILAVVDCTGHGVPGAFMSMIGNTLLNQIVNEKHITTPSEILRLLNLEIYEALHQKKDGALSNDGMDIALCSIDYKNNEVQYAGAKNPLYVLSDGQIEVIKGDIYGIGGGGMIAKIHDPVKKEYTNHVIAVKKDISIYLFSDGYADQFGNSNRKKFGTQKFKNLLLKSQHLSMQKQKELIVSAHAEWKGNTPQIDDVLVIGVRI